ncbi:MAG: outer membrane protein assembly factor BamB [Woeseiaceae bacterium]|nr:outer membrane protein assembly factor BamB [Woeseiaceae bacterium]
MTPFIRTASLLALAMLLSACGWFGNKDDKAQEPMELTDIETKVSIKRLWSVKVGGEAEFLRVALRPVGDGTRIYAASRDGNVVALHPESGKEFWRSKLDIELSAGPGVGENIVVVGSADGVLIALDAASGAEKWRTNVSGESLARPLVSGNHVIAITIDNRLHAVSTFDGSVRWSVDQPTPRLTMRGSAPPVAVGSSVVAGFDNGKLLAVDLDSGDVVWEQMLSPPSGRSDLERLADVDGHISVVGQDVYAAGYHGSLASLAAESGQVLWAREISTFEGVSADWNNLYTVTETGEIVALTRRNGDETWRVSSLLRREPTLPIPFRTTVVVGDLEGYLHFFSNFDGAPAARLRQGDAAISAEPVVVADRLYVQNDAGSVAAYAVREPARRKAPDISEEGS